MRLFDKHPNKRMEVDTVEALQESLVELYDSLMTDDHIGCASLWCFDDENQRFEYTAGMGEWPSSYKIALNEQQLFGGLASELKDYPYIRLNELNETGRAHLLSHLNSNEAMDVLIIPVCPARSIDGLIFVTAAQAFTSLPDSIIDQVYVFTQAVKEAFLAFIYNQQLEKLEDKASLLSEIERIGKIGGWELLVEKNKLTWTDETYRIYGLEPGENVSTDIGISAYQENDKHKVAEAFKNLVEHGQEYQQDFRFKDMKGEEKWVRTSGRIGFHKDGTRRVFGAFEDVTNEKQLIESEHKSAQFYQAVLNGLHESLVMVSESGHIIQLNDATQKLFGYQREELIGKNVSILMPPPYDELHDKYIEEYLKSGSAKIIGVGRELPAVRKNGNIFPMELSLSEGINTQNERVFIGVIRDISERKEAESEIYRLAYYNQITELPNRRSFEEHLSRLLEKAKLIDAQVIVSKINIDRFAKINLSYGREAGDYVLKMVSDRMHKVTRPAGLNLYHGGADTFYILYPHPLSHDNAETLSQVTASVKSLLHEVSSPIAIGHENISLTASITSCVLLGDKNDLHEVYECIDSSLSVIKRSGGNQYQVVNELTDASFKRIALIKKQLTAAVVNDEFSLFLQPQFSPKGEYQASEALLRWYSPELGMVSPSEFIHIAEQTGDIVPIGYWVIKRVCRLISIMRPPGRIAINISAKQVAHPQFEEKLEHYLSHFSVKGSSLVLEITETSLVEKIDYVLEKLRRLRDLGIDVSIDDFGTGYSSLGYLKILPVNEIKIDKSFVDEITDNSQKIVIVDSIITLAKSIGARVVAEGVEKGYQLDYLTNRGCDLIQGYFFAKPLPIDEWTAKLEQYKKRL